MERKFISHDDVTLWLDALSCDRVVFAPVLDSAVVTFRPHVKGRKPVLDRAPVQPPKEGVFPQSETLLKYRYIKDAENLDKTDVEVKEMLPAEQSVVVGARPCGTRGMLVFDRVYNCDAMRDPYYAKRRENTLHVTLACSRIESTCFCHDVGSNPADSEGSDVLLIPVEGGYVADAITDAGGSLIDMEFFSAAGERAKEADALTAEREQKLPKAHDYADSRDKLMAVFDDLTFWEKQSAKCISCGACTYLCPTCYCFNITDESVGLTGKRVRTWDNCMSFEFTLEGSGHNPRPTKAHRLRNRVNHKFAYYRELHDGVIACCGCGRCIKSCPASVDIRAIVQAAQSHTPKEDGNEQ